MPNYWLIVERLDNWHVDRANQFSFFGIPERKRAMAGQIAEGDYLFTYVSSGLASFADVRRLKPGGLLKLHHGGDYDTTFGFAISTEPVIVLPEEDWVPIQSLTHRLELTRGRKDWRQIVRVSLRPLTESDGKFLLDILGAKSRALKDQASKTAAV